MENLDYDSDRASSAGPDAAPAVTSVDAVNAADTVTRRDFHDLPRMHPMVSVPDP